MSPAACRTLPGQRVPRTGREDNGTQIKKLEVKKFKKQKNNSFYHLWLSVRN
jgi:hypothetical protein